MAGRRQFFSPGRGQGSAGGHQPGSSGGDAGHDQAGGGEAEVFAADVSQVNDCRSMVEHVMKRWGKLDILDNNVGISGSRECCGPLMRTPGIG